MKRNRTAKDLREFLSFFGMNLQSMAEEIQGKDVNDLLLEYRNQVLNKAYQKVSTPMKKVRPAQLPKKKGEFYISQKSGVIQIAEDNKTYATLDSVVLAHDLPMLVEIRLVRTRDALRRYFSKIWKKQEMMEMMFGQEYGIIVMLPLELRGRPAVHVRDFKDDRGLVAYMPYQAADFHRALANVAHAS